MRLTADRKLLLQILKSSGLIAAICLLLVAPSIYALSIPSQVSVSNFTGLSCNATFCIYPTTISGTQNYFALNSSSSCLYGYCGAASTTTGGAAGTSANAVIQDVFNVLKAGSTVYFSFGNYSVVGDLNLTTVAITLTFQPGTILTFSGLTTGGLVYDPTPHNSASGPIYINGFPTFTGSNSGKTALIVRDGYSSGIYHNSTGRSNVALNVRGTWTAGVSIEGVTYEGTFLLDVTTTGPASGTGTGIQFQNSPASDGTNAPNNNLLIKPETDVTPGTKGNSIGINLINGNNEVIENFDGNYITSNGTALKIATIGNRIISPRFESNAHDINFTTGADKNSVILPIYTGDPSGNPTIVDTSTGINNYQTDGISNNYGQYIPASNVLSYYPMDEGSGTSLFDLSNTVAAGVLTNTPTWQTPKHCVFGDCLSFANGSSQYVALTSPSAALPVTETLWFNASTFPVNGNKPEEIAQIEAGDLSLVANASGTYARINGLGLGATFAPEGLLIAHWYFLAAIVTSTYQQLCINVSDTALSCSSQLTGTTSGNLGTWTLAKASTGSFYYYNGKLDNVEIFSSALSQTQIYQDFQQTPFAFEIAYASEGLTCASGQVILSNSAGSTCGYPLTLPSFNNGTQVSTTATSLKQVGQKNTFVATATTYNVIANSGAQTNHSTCGVFEQLDYGTGAAPAQGAAQTGTLIGQGSSGFFTATGEQFNFPLVGQITGLTVGTTYWIDIAFRAAPGASCGLATWSTSVIDLTPA